MAPNLTEPVSQLTISHLLQVLQPIWTKHPVTASRVRGRIEMVLSYATVRGWREHAQCSDLARPLASRVARTG
jgi:hypothetical protein